MKNLEGWRIGRTDMRSYTGDGEPVHYLYPPDEGERIPFYGDDCVERATQVRDLLNEREDALARANDRIRCWTDGYEPPAIEDCDAIGPPDIAELIEAAPRFTGDREGGNVAIDLEVYEAVVSRSEIVAYGRALAWQQQRIRELEEAKPAEGEATAEGA